MNKQYLTVTALTRYIRAKLEKDPHLQQVYVKGEISNFTHHRSGHMYFTLKDNETRIKAVMFITENRNLKFRLESGMQILARGNVGVFESNGEYQLYVKEIEPDGIGALFVAYEQLKEQLNKSGYFAAERKLSIPQYPKKIALVTSPTGAAVRDMITTIKRRYPIVEITIVPTSVQGDKAPTEIVNAIKLANNYDFDTIILARGGGSIEELWNFNHEQVALAIFHSKIPIITGIGHETDVTISDFVADLRAPTPTAAAELAVPSLKDVRVQIDNIARHVEKLSTFIFMKKSESLQTVQTSKGFFYPQQLLKQKAQYVDTLAEQIQLNSKLLFQVRQQQYNLVLNKLMSQHPQNKLHMARQDLDYKINELDRSLKNNYLIKQHNFNHLIEKLTVLNPLQVMKRGFAVPYNREGKIIRRINDVSVEDSLYLKLLDGKLICTVEEVEEVNGE